MGEMRYLFRHVLLRAAAYAMQAQARLRELHARAALAIEAVGYLSRALELTPEHDLQSRYELLLACEQVHNMQGARVAQAAAIDALAVLADRLDDHGRRSESCVPLAMCEPACSSI